jgi:hypothetical protein
VSDNGILESDIFETVILRRSVKSKPSLSDQLSVTVCRGVGDADQFQVPIPYHMSPKLFKGQLVSSKSAPLVLRRSRDLRVADCDHVHSLATALCNGICLFHTSLPSIVTMSRGSKRKRSGYVQSRRFHRLPTRVNGFLSRQLTWMQYLLIPSSSVSEKGRSRNLNPLTPFRTNACC